MEEILASIRRIIADDETVPQAKAAEPPRPELKAPELAKPATAAPAPRPSPPQAAEPLQPKSMPVEPLSNEDASPAAAAAPQKPEVFELTEDMTAMPANGTGFRTIDSQSDVVFADSPPASPPAAAAAAASTAAAPPPLGAREGLMSGAAVAAVDSAFNSLARTVLLDNARTLEDLVREMLRPMLKSWLDDNLPGVVERLVRAEIERVSRGRG